jgi:hypothetical protein
MDCVEGLDQHEYVILEASKEAIGYYVCKTNDLCMDASYRRNEDGQPSKTIIKGVKGLSHGGREDG